MKLEGRYVLGGSWGQIQEANEGGVVLYNTV